MEQSGTLRKRRRRTLVKVQGLSAIPYDPEHDNYTGRYDTVYDNRQASTTVSTKPISTRAASDTRIRLSAKEVKDYRRTATAVSRSRVTRDPLFHQEPKELDEDIEKNNIPVRKEDVGEDSESIQGRSYFLDKRSMLRLKQLVWIGSLVGSYPWKWNQKDCRVERWSPNMEKLWWIQWFFWSIQTLGLACFQVYAFIKFLSIGHTSYREVFMTSFGALWYTYALLCNINLYYHKEETRQYINAMLNFNHRHVKKYLISLDGHKDSGQIVINLCFFSNLTQLFLSSSLFLRMPFQPWYLFSYIYPKPWYWLIPGLLHEIMLTGQVVISYLLVSWSTVVHTNTLHFWLREIHNNNDTGFTSDDIREPRNAMEIYKTLQVLNKCFNECMAPLGIPYWKIVNATALVSCGYVMIRSMNQLFIDEFPGILTYPFSMWDCGVVGFVMLSLAAQAFDLSCSFIDSWSITGQKDFRRILMSCQSFKIYTGKFYYITGSSTITFFREVFNYITDAILTFP